MKWNSLDHNIQKAGSFGVFKNNILKFIRPTFNSASICEYYRGIKLMKRLRVGLVHLRKHRFKHSFQNKLNLSCSCGFDVESTSHDVLHCSMYSDERYTLLNTTKNIYCRLLDLTKTLLINTLSFGVCSVDAHTNTQFLNVTTIDYILTTKIFDESLFDS